MSVACRFCGEVLHHTVIDLGTSPLCESYVTPGRTDEPEKFYELRLYICDSCWLVQLPEYVRGEEIFREYAYFSSFSTTWLTHARRFRDMVVNRFGIGRDSVVVEVASNDGYALQYFVERGIPSLGIEPAANVARAAVDKGVPTRVDFFDRDLARQLVEEGTRADLLFANNVLGHVHDLNGFVAGLKLLLAPGGVLTLEFPHLLQLIEGNQFDTIYHEHFSYFSLNTAVAVLAAHGMTVFDVEELTTHGGSLRVFARHQEEVAEDAVGAAVTELLDRELSDGLLGLEYYRSFRNRVWEAKWGLLEFLIGARRTGKSVVGYGAPGKGNTLLNYCGVRTDLLEYTVDRNPYKQGKLLPGSRIPVHAPEHIEETRPDFVLILPWNLRDEIVDQLAGIRSWGGRFVIPIPEIEVIS